MCTGPLAYGSAHVTRVLLKFFSINYDVKIREFSKFLGMFRKEYYL